MGHRTNATRPNGVNTGYTYDNLSRLLSVLHQLGGITKDGATYNYDNVGNRTSKTFVQQSDPDPVSVVAGYSYDNIYQLTQTLLDGGLSESYSYDEVGNRTASLGVSPYLYNNSNELTSTPLAGFSYDEDGNTTSKTDGNGTTNYTWDYENRLVSASVPGTGTVAFAYDPFGRRIFRSSASGTTIYAYDGDNVVEELDGSGGVVARYIQGLGIDEPLATYRGGVASYYHADGLGSVTSLTDGSGTVAASYVYDSFGSLSSSTGTLTNSFRYTGREFDSETGLYYYRARYYDLGTSRFLSEDRLGFYADENFYRYVKNDPVNFIDPSGLECEQISPWKETPGLWSAAGPKPYATLEEGLFWKRIDWNFAQPLRISCICRWVAASTRIRRFYRVRIREEALFKCTDCGAARNEYRIRDRYREYESSSPGRPIMPAATATTSGPTVQTGDETGSFPTKNNVDCACPPPAR